jgi:hypothetical protein
MATGRAFRSPDFAWEIAMKLVTMRELHWVRSVMVHTQCACITIIEAFGTPFGSFGPFKAGTLPL